jgi:hypothetical protein
MMFRQSTTIRIGRSLPRDRRNTPGEPHMKFFKRVITALSSRADYEAAISAIEEAILSGKLSTQDKRQKATDRMPFESVADLLSVLKSTGKVDPNGHTRESNP